ncbi:MAG TPA: TolC family protein [Chitinophagaceae bacterium]|nr:TolC family protein [Chitinophagaceae bacterium]
MIASPTLVDLGGLSFQLNVVKVNSLILTSLLFSSTLCIQAQKFLSLEEAVATALQNNYNIQLSKNDSMVAALDYSYRNAVFLPRLNSTMGSNWSENNQKQEFTSGTKREGGVKTNNYNASVSLNWTLFDGLKMFATRDKAEEFIKLGEIGIKNEIINTVAAVVANYYAIVRQKQQLKAIEEQMSISQTRVDLSQRRLEIGVGAKPDVLQSKVDLNAQIAARLNQQTLIEQLKEQLNQSMNVALNTGYEVSDTIPINMNVSLDDIQNNIETTNPILQITKKNIDIAYLTLKERKAERLPTLSFNSSYNFNRTNNNVALNPALPIYNRNRGYNYGFVANIPILNNRNNNRLIKQAELNISYQQLVFDNQKSLLNLAVINAFKDYEMQKQALDLEEANILLARENVTIILETYRLGAATYLQLREAQKSLEDAFNRLIAARYNTKLAETELMRLKGDLVK